MMFTFQSFGISLLKVNKCNLKRVVSRKCIVGSVQNVALQTCTYCKISRSGQLVKVFLFYLLFAREYESLFFSCHIGKIVRTLQRSLNSGIFAFIKLFR